MRTAMLLTLLLAAALIVPATAQQTTSDQQPAAQSSSNAAAPDANSDQNLSAQQPLQPDTHEGFWGKINPFARKKYVQKQLSPIRNRVNELDDLTAANARQIKDVDARAQAGIRDADAKAMLADQVGVAGFVDRDDAQRPVLEVHRAVDARLPSRSLDVMMRDLDPAILVGHALRHHGPGPALAFHSILSASPSDTIRVAV